MYDEYKPYGFVAKTIWAFDNITVIKYYASQYTYPHFQDIGYAAWNAYNINNGVPLNYVVDPQGIVQYGATGFYESTIRSIIESYLPGVSEYTTEFKPIENISIAPNPANVKTNLRFSLSKAGRVNVRIYSSAGKLIKTIFNGNLPAGVNNLSWDLKDDAGHSVANGIYLYELVSEISSVRTKVSVLR